MLVFFAQFSQSAADFGDHKQLCLGYVRAYVGVMPGVMSDPKGGFFDIF